MSDSEEDAGAGAARGPGHYRRNGSIFGEMLRTLSERFGEDPLDYDSDDEPRMPMAQRAVVGATLRACPGGRRALGRAPKRGHAALTHAPRFAGHAGDGGASPECWEEPPTTSFLIRGVVRRAAPNSCAQFIPPRCAALR